MGSYLGFGTQVGVQSPWAPADNLATFAAAEVLGAMSSTGAVTREIALRVPGVKRAHGIHCAIFAGIPFYQMDDTTRTTEQPEWLTNSQSGVSPYHRAYGFASDLFMSGWGCLGFTDDMRDAIHIPVGLWAFDADTGAITVDERIPAAYRARPIATPLGYGSNGILVDGFESIRAARAIERAWIERVENPIPATDLHITNPQYDQMSKREQRKIVDEWNSNRARSGGQTAITQSFLEVRALGNVSADLFEKGRNAVRLDLANHSAVPASVIEGSKDSGGSDIEYTGKGDKRNEMFDFGTRNFVQAFEARMSLDDVTEPGLSIRGDLSGFIAAPSPTTNPTSRD
jgi:hypothetical protein